jgi:hypothetical protein
MKQSIVALLIRLYPARWRSEYGAEFSDLLLSRPLTARELLNVLGNALWQQCRAGEPWIVIGVPLAVPAVIACIQAFRGLPFADPHAKVSITTSLAQVAAYFAVGFWTMKRRGGAAGRAAIKTNMLAASPLMFLGLLGLTRLLAMPAYWREILTFGPILQIPFAGLVGWLGGQAARLARRRHTTA